MEEIDVVVQRVAGWPLATVLGDDARWDDPACATPGLVALQLALAACWRIAGVAPDVVLGQGVGELAAACAAGSLTAEEALRGAVAGSRGDAPGRSMAFSPGRRRSRFCRPRMGNCVRFPISARRVGSRTPDTPRAWRRR